MSKDNPWRHYRLGDMLTQPARRDEEFGREKHFRLWPDSLASQYMRAIDKLDKPFANQEVDFKILGKLVNEFPLETKPRDSQIIVHIRTGDVIENCPLSVDEILSGDWRKDRKIQVKEPLHPITVKVCSLPYYEGLMLKETGVSNITIVTSDCHSDKYDKSERFIEKIKEFFEESGYNVHLRLEHLPDEDFVFMCRSKFFVSGGGGFSRICWKLRQDLGLYNVCSRSFPPHWNHPGLPRAHWRDGGSVDYSNPKPHWHQHWKSE